MRLLMLYCSRFSYRTSVKGLENVEEVQEENTFENALVGFIHIEPEDEQKLSAIETKLVKNLKWAARKNETNRIVLHSFAHLSEKKGDPEVTKKLFNNAEERLKSAGYETAQTPFGYFLDIDVQAPGHSFARLFKEF
ncbi:MAG: threonyl-tRNA synthetase editing domain-containing protein [Caldisericaceae bacterium]|nr:threonyl-tRNA synthetase editing domain-containing protein [Caldisericaceae bacterium]